MGNKEISGGGGAEPEPIAPSRPNSFPVINYNDIKRHLSPECIVGKGAFGTVYSADTSVFPFLKDKKDVGEKVAVKIMRASTSFEKEFLKRMVRRGIEFCLNVSSKHVLEIFGMVDGMKEVGYVMELCDKSLDRVIQDDEEMSIEEKVRILKETALGANALHQKDLMHRNMKWGDVMLGFDKVVKLTDFDTLVEDRSKWKQSDEEEREENIGTPGFRPPEVIKENKWTQKGDVFAFGMMIFCLFWGMNVPYVTQTECSCGQKISDILAHIHHGFERHVSDCGLRPLLKPEEVEKYPKFLMDLMVQCWEEDAQKRPTFEEIVKSFPTDE